MKTAIGTLLILLGVPLLARERPDQMPLTKPDDTYVSVSAHGCMGTCPIFELTVFDDGQVVFRGTRFTAKLGVFYRNATRSTYTRLRKLLDDRHALGARPECTQGFSTDFPGVTVTAQDANGRSEGFWYFGSGCQEEVDMATELYDSFVIETNTANLVSRDTREWEKKSRARQRAK